MGNIFPTLYKGYSFRNETQARWAVFFDTLGIVYNYEPTGSSRSGSTFYQPDFKLLLPGQEPVYCEVAEDDFELFDDDRREKRWLYTALYGSRVLVLSGLPELSNYRMVGPENDLYSHSLVVFSDQEPHIVPAEHPRLYLVSFDNYSGRMGSDIHHKKAVEAFGGGVLEAVEMAWSVDFAELDELGNEITYLLSA